jgi:hypothetical protein
MGGCLVVTNSDHGVNDDAHGCENEGIGTKECYDFGNGPLIGIPDSFHGTGLSS